MVRLSWLPPHFVSAYFTSLLPVLPYRLQLHVPTISPLPIDKLSGLIITGSCLIS